MTTTDASIVTAARIAASVTSHIVEHALPEPVSIHLVMKDLDGPFARVQLDSSGLADTAQALLTWARTFPAVTIRAWRPVSSDSVHLDVDAVVGSVRLTVFGCAPFDSAVFPGLGPGQKRPMPLGRLITWAGVSA